MAARGSGAPNRRSAAGGTAVSLGGAAGLDFAAAAAPAASDGSAPPEPSRTECEPGSSAAAAPGRAIAPAEVLLAPSRGFRAPVARPTAAPDDGPSGNLPVHKHRSGASSHARPRISHGVLIRCVGSCQVVSWYQCGVRCCGGV